MTVDIDSNGEVLVLTTKTWTVTLLVTSVTFAWIYVRQACLPVSEHWQLILLAMMLFFVDGFGFFMAVKFVLLAFDSRRLLDFCVG